MVVDETGDASSVDALAQDHKEGRRGYERNEVQLGISAMMEFVTQ